MAVFKCKMCGGNLVPNQDGKTAVCDSCDSLWTLPNDQDERLANMHNRANDLRVNSEFDRAISVYEKVIAEDGTDAEAYWGLLLCKYGIEYVKDPATGRYIPTCHRAKYGSILNDPDYQNVISRADPDAKVRYEQQAKEIDSIMQEILSIAAKQERFDVFISYKEQDEGERTMDSFRARSLYDKLTARGIRTFYAPESLPLGKNYEPIIFSALHSARVMVLLGSKPEYFTAPWVKNEWARYLELINKGEEKTLIPAYWDLIPEIDFPREIASLQAVNMGTPVGELQLLEYIQKLTASRTGGQAAVAAASAAPTSQPGQQEVQPLLKRADIFLDNGQFDEAATYYNRALDKAPENAQAYWGLLLCRRKCRTAEDLIKRGKLFNDEIAYKNAIRFAKPELKKTYEAVHTAVLEQVERVCRALDDELRNKINQAGLRQAANDIQAQLQSQQEETSRFVASMKETADNIQQQISAMDTAAAPLQQNLNAAQQQYDQQRQRFNDESNPHNKVAMISNLIPLRQSVERAYTALKEQYVNSELASALHSQVVAYRRTDAVARQTIATYQELQQRIEAVTFQADELKRQCESLKAEVRVGEYEGAWQFLGRTV